MRLISNRLCLVVDDDSSIRSYIAALLRHVENFDTVEADGGRHALDLVNCLGADLDLIVSDIQMPNGDGVTFAHAVRRTFAELPVILVSADEPPPEARGFEFVQKPFAPNVLLQVVQRVLASRVWAA